MDNLGHGAVVLHRGLPETRYAGMIWTDGSGVYVVDGDGGLLVAVPAESVERIEWGARTE